MKHPRDPDASFRDRTRCRHDAIKQIGIRTHENLLNASDSESNVLIIRNLHSAVSTKIVSFSIGYCSPFLCQFWLKSLKTEKS